MDNKNSVIKFENVSFSYNSKKQVLKNVSYEIYEKEYVCIVGHNGSGKSTMSKLLTGILKPLAGTIYLFGYAISRDNIKFLRDNVGIIFQNPDNQFIGITAEDDIAFGLENRKIPRGEIKRIIDSVADKVGIKDILKFEPHKLSGGQKQRVAIASVLAINPSIILFDESTSMLDPKGKKDIKSFMLQLRNQGKTVISITHDMEEVVNCDRVLVMDHGNLIKQGRPDEIFKDKQFLRDINLDVPFSLDLAMQLNELDEKINSTLRYNELIDNICSRVDQKD
ncbi:energy-coupling factor transporter ATPase [Mycoplasmoides gallisepticum]|uniref:Energy-coupling factor transporter ATP-binding protein EcfA1 n=4 Tax=Mycoplasmoides gallisepticum TaxID=2096 RepID=ECFA1_MYCGA|nr:energy-coupling factor transporter ATPase [Mycoplasmoides gallisepticum]Q7NAQ6.1 RecName: Full=Energy-coupling factor transporter ATP-binding protein EcfA1; Short=ECF transporter A component EcfA1 [Mycoplasmoides gallisepticum str. R(low)]AAP56929.1 ABC-type cobalt transport ATP-binding protein [Mycoplasmoides gallisepticum str. R(low)]ADC30793.1 ABC-type cobalt transport ATP-binding protein [Mycoplasmoides gallisepticum str. R(high)]ADC31160.1 ABC-type cobalt transport ATP-binding protein [